MNIACLYLHDMVVIPGGLIMGDTVRGDLRECVFRAEDGWSITEVSPGRFELRAAWLSVPFVIVGASDYEIVPAIESAPSPVSLKLAAGQRVKR